ncbi:hypothetical protein E4U44_008134 [Claviceps purpurea]|nr:hypothetical protein E4U44_008134 [Claviceps purpurea]
MAQEPNQMEKDILEAGTSPYASGMIGRFNRLQTAETAGTEQHGFRVPRPVWTFAALSPTIVRLRIDSDELLMRLLAAGASGASCSAYETQGDR